MSHEKGISVRKIILAILAAVFVVAGIVATAPASQARQSCTTGQITVRVSYGPPGKVSADLATADNPPGCSGVWTRAKSNDGLNYYSGIIHITGINATASTCQDTSDCTHLVKGWVYKHPSGGAVRCKVVYPAPGAWRDCGPHPAPPAHVLALERPWTYQRLHQMLRSSNGPFLICALNHPAGKDRMGMWYALNEANVLAEPCDASREWKLVHKGNDSGGVPQVEINAVADGNWLAATNGCTWVIRKFDDTQSGTVWKLYIHDGDLFIASRRCSGVDSNGKPRYNKAIATNNRLDNRWFIADWRNPDPGDFIRMSFKVPSSEPMI